MGECYCSNITIMQLFHELKQQFPALPDHIVSQCIAQNSHDKETCARSLRVTQEARPSPGAFPPRAPDQTDTSPQDRKVHAKSELQHRRGMLNNYNRATSLNGVNETKNSNVNQHYPRAHRPASLDIDRTFGSFRCSRLSNDPSQLTKNCNESSLDTIGPAPLSAPPNFYPTRGGFFEDFSNSGTTNSNRKISIEAITVGKIPTTTNNINLSNVIDNKPRNRGNQSTSAGFELNVNVACSPAGNHDFRIIPKIGTAKQSDPVVEQRPRYVEPRLPNKNSPPEQTRSYTSVSLTLRPPSSENQAPIDIRSQGSSLTYSASSLDPRGFQSRLQISIGPGSVGSVASARIRPPMGLTRPSTLLPHHPAGQQRPPGLPVGPPSQLSRPTTTMSAPTTPSAPVASLVQPISLPTTPSTASAISSSSPNGSPTREQNQASLENDSLPLKQVAEHQTGLIAKQLMRKERLEKELRAEKGRLESMKRELQSLMRPLDSSSPIEEVKRKLVSEIYQLRLECDRLADEVDKRSDPRVPLGETNEEFYQGIYTGQPCASRINNYVVGVAGTISPETTVSPSLPNRPPAWQLPSTGTNHHSDNTENRRNDDTRNDDWDERDGPSWVCRMCTFDNHPLMDKCEQCDMPRLIVRDTGETQDIHIRVTHHHNFTTPRRTVHSWVV